MGHDSGFKISKQIYDAVIFDLDGVVTMTAKIHAAAWKELFDGYLEERAARTGERFRPFELPADYRQYVDGKSRYQGVESFLRSRDIELPYGETDDGPELETICSLGNRKNQLFHRLINKQGVEVYDSTIALIGDLKVHGVKTAVVSSSKNCRAILQAGRLSRLFDITIDGIDAERLNLKGKPDPAVFIEAVNRLGVAPRRAVVVEDAIAGIRAGKRGGFGCVIAVDRSGQSGALEAAGADAVVRDLSEINFAANSVSVQPSPTLPSALDHFDEIARRAEGKRLAVFLDYDGTLTPIVARPELAVLSEPMRATIKELARLCPVAVISGRDLPDVRARVGVQRIFYAGSHGFDIAGPEGNVYGLQKFDEFIPALDRAERELRQHLAQIPGALVERKRFSIAVHYRHVAGADVAKVAGAVDEIAAAASPLRYSRGKKVYDLKPAVDWHKGKALLRLLRIQDLDRPDVLPFYIGDDTTDEDAFAEIQERGVGILVAGEPRVTLARFILKHPDDVKEFLGKLTAVAPGAAA